MVATVGVCGYSGTGSSAVTDLLKEYSENQVIDACEFILPYEPDGLLDLKYHLFDGSCKFSSSNTAIFRFRKAVRGGQFQHIRRLTHGKLVSLSEEYLDKIIECSWIGSMPGEICRKPIRNLARRAIFKFKIGKPYYLVERIVNRELPIFPLGRMWFSSCPSDFYQVTQEFIYRVLAAIEPLDDSKNIVLDQPFPGNNPELCFPFFTNPKAIVVDRDPRDLYLLSKEFWFKSQVWRPLPTNSVEQFITYYKSMRSKNRVENSAQVMRIQFEDLIYRYDETRNTIEDFLGLEANRHQKSRFDPGKSINNTQLFNYYDGYESDIAQIEAGLPEYIYPFERYGTAVFNRSEMFE